MNVPAPGGPDAKQKAVHEKLSKLTGAQFDREFAIHMIADHEKDIAEYKKEAKRSDAAAEYAKGQTGVLQKHLEIAKPFEQVPDRDWTDAIRAGDFERAWCISDRSLREYCASGAVKHAGERHHQRIWRGERLAGKRVLVRCYHGLGDTIQFIRFAKPLREIAKEVIVWAQPDLAPILRNVAGVDSVLPLHDGSPAVAYDVDIEIMELAHALRVSPELVSESVPYLPRPDQPGRLGPPAPLSIGLVWEAGNWDRRRCVPPNVLALLASETGAKLFSLQQGTARQAAASIPANDIAVDDIEKLARLIEKLDLVVTVDTMVAHLAGALGASVWTMLHADCDWRWPARGHNSLWYPTMKLFHQRLAGDWTTVIEEMVEGLKQQRMPCLLSSNTGRDATQ